MTRTNGERESPKSVDEVVEVIVAELPQDDVEFLKSMERSELNNLHFSLGMEIRNRFVYPGGEELKRAVALQRGRIITAPNGDSVALVHPDDISTRIIEALWSRLREDERP